MICGTFTKRQLTKNEADLTVKLFKLSNPPPTSVTETPDSAGTYTVTATWPPCPAGTTHSVDGASN
jgi:hypothetical protein